MVGGRDHGRLGQNVELKRGRTRKRGHLLTFLSVTVIYTVGVPVQSDAAPPVRRRLVQSKDGDALHNRRFLL